MKTYQRNPSSIRNIVCFGAMILITMIGVSVAAESVRNSRDYSFVSKPRSKTRGAAVHFDPPSLYSARGFGKRTSDFQPSNLYRHESMMVLPLQKDSQRLPVNWLMQILMKNPELLNTIERKILYGDEATRSTASLRFKEDDNEESNYFNE